MARNRFNWLILTVFLAGLSACERFAEKAETPPDTGAAETIVLTRIGFDDLPQWQLDAQAETWPALQRSCAKFLSLPPETNIGSKAIPMTAGDWRSACGEISAVDGLPDEAVRDLLSSHFNAYAVVSSKGEELGLFTGYFEAELKGARQKSADYPYPLYGRPGDLVSVDLGQFSKDLKGRQLIGQVRDGRIRPYPERGDIESGLLDNKGLEIAWAADAVDVFLLQVQGSGRLTMDDGSVMRVGFAAHNGRPYKSIGRHLIDLGELKPHEASWDGIRGWLEANPDKHHELFAVNPRFVFFRELNGDGPIGSQGVALTPGRSLAVDKRFIPMGVPVWLDTVWPSDHDRPLRRLMVAQDTGGAIKGVVRGDFFWGYGAEALKYAGRMKSPGRYFLLLPKGLDGRLQLAGS